MQASQLRCISYTFLLRHPSTGKNVTNIQAASEFLRKMAEQEEKEAMTNLNGGGGISSASVSKSGSGSGLTKSLVQEHPNWTGDESIQDAVLRMLMDKYKPLRGGSIRTAEEKIKESLKPGTSQTTSVVPEQVVPRDSYTSDLKGPSGQPSHPSTSTSSSETHKPWLTIFRPPSHTPSVKYMNLPPPISARSSPKDPSISNPDDTRIRMIERDKKRKAVLVGRLTNAKEASLDYRLGRKGQGGQNSGQTTTSRINPISLKGWNSLVEERIERARQEGLFRNINGRGKPLARETEQSNPFIPREEFLLNRIVQRQGAAPAWVEFQAGEYRLFTLNLNGSGSKRSQEQDVSFLRSYGSNKLESAITTFRSVLRSSWTRKALRTLTTTNHPAFLPKITLTDITRLRDDEWETREKGYHDKSIAEINSLVRKYNGVAPYAVRRSVLDRRSELERMYEECKEDILEEIGRRVRNPDSGGGVIFKEGGYNEDEDDRAGGVQGRNLHQSGRIIASKGMYNWRTMWSKLISFLGG
ncbi:hypothetical protein Clacol_001163 [Clathrus columnatus]|uniref:DnaJ homologue subfamily C member 28 conserved domain-containing protein n=1 Tax=Clathrus columnatus TaxID=1419009 RepID=A0AAV5A332_9AGAM|nr:hypothetical protein Clacol_001163 [Clathrus columnatus]